MKNFFESVNIWQSYKPRTWLSRVLSSSFSSAVARRTICTRQPRLIFDRVIQKIKKMDVFGKAV